MAEEHPTEIPASTPDPSEEEPVLAVKSQGRNRKLMLILAVAMLGGVIAGIGGTVVISSFFKENPTPVPVAKPVQHDRPVEPQLPDPKQEALIKELKEQKERLEAQLKQKAEVSAHEPEPTMKSELPTKVEPPPVPPPRVIYRTINSKEKKKITEDCTITNKTDGLDERLKNCIEEFNNATR